MQVAKISISILADTFFIILYIAAISNLNVYSKCINGSESQKFLFHNIELGYFSPMSRNSGWF